MSDRTKASPTPELAAILDRMAAEDGALPDPTTLPPPEGRAQTARVHARWRVCLPRVRGVETFLLPDADGGAMRCRRIDPPIPPEPGAILFIHGGGWAFCDIDTHEDPMRRLAIAAGIPVFACDYRLAPEHGFPAGLRDCLSFWRRLRDGPLPCGPCAGPLYVAGDSAGANIALSMILSEIDAGQAPPDGALLIYGVYSADLESETYRVYSDGPGLTREKMRRFWDWYCPQDARDDWRVTPLTAPDDLLRALPPIILVAAEVDPLLSNTEALMNRLLALGRQDRLIVLEGMVHGVIQMGARLPAMAETIGDLGLALRSMGRARRIVPAGGE